MFDLAIWYRSVGGFMGLGSTTLARVRWSCVMGAYMGFASLVHHEGIPQAALVLVGSAFGTFLGRLIGHSEFQATASLKNSLGMALVNMVRLLLIVFPYTMTNWLNMSGFQPWRFTLVLFGIGAGIAYYIGNKYLAGKDSGIYFRNTKTQWAISIPPSGVPINPPNSLDQAAIGGAEWGELLTGELVYQLMFVTALVMP